MKGIAHQYLHRSMLNVACFLTLGLCAAPLFSQELQWKVFGHLKEARVSFVTAVIGAEKALVIGGLERRGVFNEGNRGSIKATCEIIDIRSRSIVPAPSLNVPHAQCVALQTVDSNVVVIGGLTTDSTTTPLCEIFDRKKNAWRVLGSLLIGRHLHMASFINQDEIIVAGGRATRNYAGVIAEAEIFNIRTGKSRIVSDFPCKVEGGLGFTSEVLSPQHSLFFIGRSEGENSHRTSNVYRYDTLSHRWVCVASLPDGVYGAVGKRLFDGRLVFAGGLKRESRIKGTMSPYIRIENQAGFAVIGTMIQPRCGAAIEQWNKEIVVSMGGVGSIGSLLNHTEWFDLRTQQSSEGMPMNEPRASFAAVSLPLFDSQGEQKRSCIIVIGGYNTENKTLSSVEILETTNPQLIELPSAEIVSHRRQQLLTSPTVIITLTTFILILIAALLYLLYQVFIIRKQTKFSLIESASGGQEL